MATLLTNCSVVDGISDTARPDTSVLVDDGRIRAVGPAAELRGTADEIDLHGAFVMAGLINMHVHFGLILPGVEGDRMVGESEAALALRMAHNARAALEAGVTTVRLVGERKHADFALKAAIARAETLGPRIFSAGMAVIATGGHGHTRAGTIEADGPDDFRKKTREQLKAGADLIKMCISGGIAGEHEAISDAQLSKKEMRAVIDTAHRSGKKVTAHAGPAGVIRAAIECGLDCVEHGYFLDEDTARLMVERGVWLVPTIVVSRCEDFFHKIGAPEWMIRRALQSGVQHFGGLQTAIRRGVKIALGTDMMPAEPYEGTSATVRELEFYVEAGMTPLEAVRVATIRPAAWLGMADALGTVEPNKFADLIATDGDPSANISNLRYLRFVMHDGRVVRHDPPRA